MEIVRHYEWLRPPLLDFGEGYGIALDIGTTTLAFELFDLSNGKRLADFSMANRQRIFGADVITRINRAAHGAQAELHSYIIKDIAQGAAHILSYAGIAANAVRKMTVAGNTTMLHLLHNLPCHTLGVYPFTPVTLAGQITRFACLPDCEVLTLPGISTFVGADITAGIICLGGTDGEETRLLIDLGTNGETALISKGKIWVTSTAAGPAFEAGNISQGAASVAGAITAVRFDKKLKKFEYETINHALPVGICGTGVVDITAELVRHKMVDETGRLDAHYGSGVEIAPGTIFTKNDVREVQLAKSAVRAGIEILLESAGCTALGVDRVYLAGGFGFRLRPESAVLLGLFPEGFSGKIQAVGNSSLGGAALSLFSKEAARKMEEIVAQAVEVNLAAHPKFNELFMEYMLFPQIIEED
jgi:uncharacterized 2Fe-2S/4Fe-4S cluster protein (DUF4445 family)